MQINFIVLLVVVGIFLILAHPSRSLVGRHRIDRGRFLLGLALWHKP